MLRHKTAGNAGEVFAVHAQSVTEIQRGKVAQMLQKYSGGKWLKCYRNTAGEGVDAQSDALVKPKQLMGL